MTNDEIKDIAGQVKSLLLSDSISLNELTAVSSIEGLIYLMALKREGTLEQAVSIPASLLTASMRVTNTHLQYKVGGGSWQDLIELQSIKGQTGDSAFQLWQKEEGNSGKIYEDYVAYIESPAREAAETLTNQMAGIVQESASQMVQVSQNAKLVLDETKKKVDDILAKGGLTYVVSDSEQSAGTLVIGGMQQNLYRRVVRMSNLSGAAGETREYILSADPLGNDLYLAAGNLIIKDSDGIYWPSNYFIKKLYVTDSFDTKLVLECKVSVSNPANLTAMVTLEYIKYEKASFEITLPAGVDMTAVSAQFPALKYNKKFAYTYTFDDDVTQAYGKAFCTINKKWVDNEKFYHVGQVKTTGSVPLKTLGYTDGCSNEKRFTFGIAIWPNAGNAAIDNFMNPTGKNPDKYYPYLVWPDLIPLLDFGCDIYFHNVGSDYNKDNVESVLEGFKADQATTIKKSGRGMKTLMRPDGNNKYVTAGRNYEDIIFMGVENTIDDGSSPLNVTFDTNIDLFKKAQFRRYTEPIANADSLMANITTAAGSGKYTWLHDFSHAPAEFQYILDLFVKINDLYGKDGSDSVWFASVDEIYEYWFIRTFSKIKKTISGNTVKFDVYTPGLKYSYYRDFSVRVNGISSVNNLLVSAANEDVYGLSYAINDMALLVNVNCNRSLVDMSEKYTSKYEASSNDSDKEDALYFANQLKSELRNKFLARINAGDIAPVLNSVSINSGAATTFSTNVMIDMSITGRITHYRISENANLASQAWITGSSKSISFNLSSGYGAKTLYVQVKNEYGESAVKSDGISFVEKPSVTYIVTGQSNNILYGAVTPETQEVGKGDIANLTAVAKSGYLIESWNGATSSTGVGSTSGTATVSNIQANKTVICNFKSSSVTPPDPGVGDKTVICFNKDISVDKINSVDVTAANIALMSTQGYNVLNYVRLDNKPSDSTSFWAKDTAGAPYLFDVYKKGLAAYGDSGEANKKALSFSAQAGTYRARLYCNTNNGNLGDSSHRVYSLNGVTQSPDFEVKDNAANYVVFENVTPIDGHLILEMWSTKNWVPVVVNVIEIEKIS